MPVNNQTVLDKPANGATETHPARPTPDNPEKGVTYREYTHTEYNALIAANMEKHHASIRKKNNPLGRAMRVVAEARLEPVPCTNFTTLWRYLSGSLPTPLLPFSMEPIMTSTLLRLA